MTVIKQINNPWRLPKMLTVKEFRSQYDLTEAQFKTVRKMADERSSSPVVTRQGSNTWMIVNEALLLEALEECKKTSRIKVKSEVHAEDETIIAELVDDLADCGIQKMSGDRANALDDLLGTFQAMEVYKPKQIDLNGSQDEIADLLTVYASKIQEKQTLIEGRKAALSDREEKLEKARLALSLMGSVDTGIDSEALKVNDKAEKLGAVELDVKKQLALLLQSLS